MYEHLAATAELPVDRSASRLLGEAEAVADDLRDCEPAVQRQRAAVVVELLEKIEETGHSEADEHLECARTLASDLADDSDGR
nr:hypothetical protein [Natronomonas gomsonensis]